METNLPTPTTTRVYVNLPEGNVSIPDGLMLGIPLGDGVKVGNGLQH